MIKKYLAKHHSGKIVAVEVLRETDWSVFITSGSGTEQVIAKLTDHESEASATSEAERLARLHTGRGAAEILAAQWREWHGGMAWLFDPWTGRRRDARDVGSDVHGLLIVPAGTLGMDMGGGCSEKDNVACA